MLFPNYKKKSFASTADLQLKRNVFDNVKIRGAKLQADSKL